MNVMFIALHTADMA